MTISKELIFRKKIWFLKKYNKFVKIKLKINKMKEIYVKCKNINDLAEIW